MTDKCICIHVGCTHMPARECVKRVVDSKYLCLECAVRHMYTCIRISMFSEVRFDPLIQARLYNCVTNFITALTYLGLLHVGLVM